MGAYLQLVTPGIPLLGALPVPRRLRRPGLLVHLHGRCSPTMTPTDAYRGAGRPEATYAIERAMDALARPGRRRTRPRSAAATSSPPTPSPTPRPPAWSFDSGNYEPAPWTRRWRWPATRASARSSRRGGRRAPPKHLGHRPVHLRARCAAWPRAGCWPPSTTVAGGWESATVRMLPTGKVQVVTGTTPHGQGHETCWSQIVADQLGVSPDDVEVLHSDTAISPLGLDTLRVAVAGRRRHGGRPGRRQGHRQGPGHRRPPARGGRGRPRVRQRRLLRQGLARQGDARPGVSPSPPSPPTTCPTGWSPT